MALNFHSIKYFCIKDITRVEAVSYTHLDVYKRQTLMKGCEYNQPIVVCSACMPGSTAPVTIAGAVAMCNAEELAGIVLTQLINPGNPVIYLFASYGSNVQTGNASVSYTHLDVYKRQVLYLCLSVRLQQYRL